MDIETAKRELRSKSSLRAAASSPEAQRLLREVDTTRIEQAARSGNTAALRQALQTILSTKDGQKLAEQVRKAVSGHG